MNAPIDAARNRLLVRLEQLTALLWAMPELSDNTPEEAANLQSLHFLALDLAQGLHEAAREALAEAVSAALAAPQTQSKEA